jgi:hypothetical protein
MIKINAVVKAVPSGEAEAKIEEDLKITQPDQEEAQKIVAKYVDKKETDEES